MSVLAVLVPIAAVAVLVLTASAALLTVLLRLRLLTPQRWQSSWHVASVPLLPGIAAILSLVALGIPHPLAECHCASHGVHHPHLCAFHPELAAPLFWPATVVVVTWMLAVAPRLLAELSSLARTRRVLSAVRTATSEMVDGLQIRVLELGAPRAFSLGIARPVTVVDRSLWNALSTEQRRALVHHEQGHAERKDGVTLLGLRLVTALCPWPFGSGLIEAWRRAAERACDRFAADQVRDRELVAETLIAVERAGGCAHDRRADGHWALGIAEPHALEERVLSLLDERPSAPQLGNDLLALALISAGAALLILAWPGSGFHHAVETMLGLALHR